VRAVGYASFLLIGWSGLLVPSLIRSLEEALGQSDAGIGIFYFVYALSYATGSIAGGAASERLGRRAVLAAMAAVHGVGLVALGIAPGWSLFLVAALPAGLGAGALDGGMNGLFLDAFRSGRGRALNTLHFYFGIGALAAPLAIGLLVDAGLSWRPIIAATGLVALPLALGIGAIEMPPGRQPGMPPGPAGDEAPGRSRARPGLSLPLVMLAAAIAAYVASEVGVSNWLVRFLASAPLVVATTSLSLFWAGLAIGRLISARIADRFDHVRFAAAAAAVATGALVAAVLVPWLPLSIALFAIVGVASGPIFPMIIAIGGERYPDRSAAISGLLVSTAVVGGIVYPPLMGFMSVAFGLTVAMLGAALLGGACLGALLVVSALTRTEPARGGARRPNGG
jgi:fucose permease